jgi:hypothetical protein
MRLILMMAPSLRQRLRQRLIDPLPRDMTSFAESGRAPLGDQRKYRARR